MGPERDIPSSAVMPPSLKASVRSAVIWRSGSQIAAQAAMWLSTFLVIRLLDPHDYGLFAMTQVVLALFSLLNGYSFASALVQAPAIDAARTRQVFGMLILLNFGLAALQFALAPLAAAYFRQPIVADLLRVQALLYLATPFIALPNALLSRAMDFRRQAKANLAAALAGALTALACAEAGLGVWTLVAAPLALFWTRAAGMMIAARLTIVPSFRFAGARATMGFGGALAVTQIFWFVQTQADIFIAGRTIDAHAIGLYTTALFLSQILVAKFLPALNEVAFPAYARIQHDRAAMAWSFTKSVRIVMLVAMPFSLGLAVTVEPLVATVLGPKWLGCAPIARLIALAMPFFTLHALYAPATNALGRPGIAARSALAGAVIMPAAFALGIAHGPIGLGWSWLAGAPLLLAVSTAWSLPAIGVRPIDLLGAIRPPLAAGAAMALAVIGLDQVLPPLAPALRLAALVALGAVVYGGALLLVARATLDELLTLLIGPREPAAA